jgi:predicted nucleic acid-binding Zn ribbon protein
MEERKACPVCGDAIIGRIDKKFCSDQCRNEFNNKQNQDANSYIRRINHILRKNRRILEELNPEGKTKISKNKLVNKGFDFRYFTNIYRTKTGNTYYFCYEQGYLPLENNFYALVRKDDYNQQTLATTVAESQ